MKTIEKITLEKYPILSTEQSFLRVDEYAGNEINFIKQLAFKEGFEFAKSWIPVEDELPEISTFEKPNVVNVKFRTFKDDEEMICSATLEEVSQNAFENTPKLKRWFVYPSEDSYLKTVTHWREI